MEGCSTSDAVSTLWDPVGGALLVFLEWLAHESWKAEKFDSCCVLSSYTLKLVSDSWRERDGWKERDGSWE